MKERIAFATLGCRLNQFESNGIAANFIKNGYKIVPFNEIADVYVINTCSVTNKSDAKSRYLINRFNRLNPNALLVVTGCYAQTDADKIRKINGVNYVIPNSKKYDIFNIVTNALHKKNPINICDIESNFFDYKSIKEIQHTRSYLKIQDGCNEYCSYCKIPHSRGQARSRTYLEIMNHFKELINLGYKEIILTGINIGDYSNESFTLDYLLRDLLNIEGNFRLHLSSIEPNKVTQKIIALLDHPKMCQHLHLPLQSASNKILKLMNRKYTKEKYKETINKIRKKMPNINLTTDLMVGFPEETKEDFFESFNLIEELKLSHVHTFKYSIRNKTVASEFKSQVDEFIKSERSLKIRELSSKLQNEYAKNFLHKKIRVLTERKLKENIYTGYSDHYIRVNYKSSTEKIIGNFQTIFIDEILSTGHLSAQIS